MVLPSHESQFDLESIGLRVAGVRRLEDCSGIATLRHEHLVCIVDVRMLASNNGMNDALFNYSCREHEVGCRCSNWTNVQMLIPAPGFEEVHVQIIDCWIGCILDLDPEWRGYGVRQWGRWNNAC